MFDWRLQREPSSDSGVINSTNPALAADGRAEISNNSASAATAIDGGRAGAGSDWRLASVSRDTSGDGQEGELPSRPHPRSVIDSQGHGPLVPPSFNMMR